MYLLAYVKTLIPRGAAVFLVGDTEFGSIKVLKRLDNWHWFYVLRQKSNTLVWSATENAWKPFCSHISKAGQSIWLGQKTFSQEHLYPVNLLVHWQHGEKEPWYLITSHRSIWKAPEQIKSILMCSEKEPEVKFRQATNGLRYRRWGGDGEVVQPEKC